MSGKYGELMIGIPEAVRGKAMASGARSWLDELPALIAELARDWSLALGRVFDTATEALVVEATTDAGVPAVLKLPIWPGGPTSSEITVLRLAGGAGCATLLRHDPAGRALLLERLGPSLFDLGIPIQRRHEILCAAARTVWRPAPGHALPTGADRARWIAEHVTAMWRELDHPCTRQAIDHAVACAWRRHAAHDDTRAVLIHGDVHQWNTLAAGDGFKLVDPDGLLAERECDLGVLMREDPVELMDGDPRDRARWLAAHTDTDPVAIWEWGVAERVSTGLILLRCGMREVGEQMLAAADHITTNHPGF